MRKHFFTDVRSAFKKVEHRLVSRAIVGGHVAYYLLVSVEAHGYYRYVAGFLFIGVVMEMLHNSAGGPHV